MKEAVVLEELPQASVAVKVTEAEPVAPQPFDRPLKLSDHTTPEQRSLAVAPP